MGKKILRVCLIVVSIIFILLIAAALGISPFVKNYIEKNSKELIGRQVTMRGLKLNIFTRTLYLDSLRMYEKDDRAVFASVDSFYMDLELLKLLKSKLEIAQLRIIRPYGVILQKEDSFNFDDLLPETDSTQVEADSTAFPQSVLIRNIYVNGGNLSYTDQILNHTIQMNDLGVAIPELAFERGNTNAGIHLKIGDSATLKSQLTLNMQTNEYLLNLQLENLPMDILQPYMAEYFHVDQFSGTLNTDLRIKGNTDHLTDFTVSGTAQANHFTLTNRTGEPVVSVQEAFAKMDRMDMATSTYLFDSIGVKGAKLDFIFREDSTDNITSLFIPEKEDLASSADTTEVAPLTFRIGRLHVRESELLYTDKTLRSAAFLLPVSDIDFISRDYDLARANQYDMSGRLPNGGKIDFHWNVNFDDLADQAIEGNFRNIDLKLFTPYCLDYTAYDITKGNMNFTTHNRIQNNYIRSMNKIDVYNMRVGNKNKEINPEYNVPLKLALYILRDKDEKIEFEIPVKGNVNDPEFSYRKIVLKTIVNLMVKVAVSPVRFLANSLGLNPDEMASMSIDALQSEINARQYAQLNELVQIYAGKPDMVLTLMQYVDWSQALEDYRMYLAKSAFLFSRTPDRPARPLPYEEVTDRIKEEDAAFRDYVEKIFAEKGSVPNRTVSVKDKLAVIYPNDSIAGELAGKLEKRNEEIRNYLTTTGGIPAEHLSILTAAADTLKQYHSRAQYKIELALPEDE